MSVQNHRALALEIASRTSGVSDASGVLKAANLYLAFLDGTSPLEPAASDTSLETSEREATPPAATSKAAAKPATKAKPEPEAKTEAKTETKAAGAVDAQKAIVSLVTAVGRESTIKFMQDTFGSPNLSGVDLKKFSYDTIIKKVQEFKEQQATA